MGAAVTLVEGEVSLSWSYTVIVSTATKTFAKI